jgi:hypothetical protein
MTQQRTPPVAQHDPLLGHCLATIAYRTQKALRGSPEGFADFSCGHGVRTPRELVRHIASVLGYARTFFIGGVYFAEPLETMRDEVERLHGVIADLGAHLRAGTPLRELTAEQLLQGPFADALTHVGQIAMLRRIAGAPVASENFLMAEISADRLGAQQPMPVAPTPRWMGALIHSVYRMSRWTNRRRGA